MLALTGKDSLFLVGVLASSLAGSMHCIGMCGGLVVACAPTPFAKVKYHVSRLIGYLALGAFGGFLGENILKDFESDVFPFISSLVLSAFLFFVAYRVYRNKTFHLGIPFGKFFLKKGPSIAGAMSAFLPCGWLHSFVAISLTSASPLRGAIILFFFWLGSLPALVLGPTLFSKGLMRLRVSRPLVTSALLVILGVGSFSVRFLSRSPIASETDRNARCQHLDLLKRK